MDEPRPTTISARPRDSKSRVANSWNKRTGSAALRTVTALVSRMCSVRAAAAPRMTVGAESEELAAVMLADPERIEPEPIGVLDLLDQVAETVGCADRKAVLGKRCGEAVDANFHRFLQGDLGLLPGKRGSI